MNSYNPKTSIVIRNRNGSEYLPFVFEALKQQEYENFEIIFVDNNSTDNSLELAKQANAKILNIQDFTYGKALNLGIKSASGELIIILSAHSIPLGRYFLSECVRHFENEKIAAARLVYTGKNSDSVRWLKPEYLDHPEQDFISMGPLASGCVIRKRAWEEVKFNENVIAAEEKVWSYEVLKRGYKIVSPVPAFYYYAKQITERSELHKNYRELITINREFKVKVGFVKESTRSVIPDLCKGVADSVSLLFERIHLEVTRAYLRLKFPKL